MVLALACDFQPSFIMYRTDSRNANARLLFACSSDAADHRERDGGHDEGTFPAGGQETSRTVVEHEERRRGVSCRDEETAAPQGGWRGRERDTGGESSFNSGLADPNNARYYAI